MILKRYFFAIILVNFYGLTSLVFALPASANTTTESEVAHSVAMDELLLQAMTLIGVAYKFGGSNPIRGLDCSGFIQYIFKQSLNLSMPRTAAEQARIGVPVTLQELKPGDLVFFNTRHGRNSHVGLYLGDDKFIHAPRTGKYIEIGNIKSSYWAKHYNGARRVIKTKNIDSVSGST